jgi:hypothetical protein
MSAPASRRQHVAVAAAFTLVWLVQAWPLVTQLGTVIPNDAGDPILNAWILWWNAHAVPLTTHWWNGPMFFPAPGALTFSENLLGLSILASPLQWLGASPIVAYNLVFLVSTPLSAFCAYLLAWALTRRLGPSLVAGVMYGFAIFRFAHVPHIQILWTFWMPLALLGLHQWLTARRKSGLAVFAIAWLGQSLSNGYYFFYFSILIGLWMLWFTRWRDLRRTLLPPLVAWMLAGLVLAPVMLTYRQVHGQYQFVRTISEIDSGGADLTEFFRVSSIPRFLGVARWERGEHEVSLPLIGIAALVIGLIGGMRGGIVRRRRRPAREAVLSTLQILLWTTALVCALIAISTRISGNWHFDALGVHVSGIARMLAVTWPALILGFALSPAAERAWRERSVVAFYLWATAIALLLSMGPYPRAWGEKIWNEGPYAWLMAIVPGLDGVRVPARCTLVAVLCTAMVTALLLARVQLARRGRERLFFGVVVGLLFFETWPPAIPMATLPARAPEISADATVIELPFGIDQETPALYRGMFHGRPTVDGYSGFFPPSHHALRLCLMRKGPECLATLQRMLGPIEIIVERQADATGEWDTYASQLPGVQPRARTKEFAVYRLPGAAAMPRTFATVPIRSITATIEPNRVALAQDGNWRTAWSTGRGQSSNDALTIEIESAPVVGVDLWLGGGRFQNEYPRGLVIETSEDGGRWVPAWQGAPDSVLFETVLASGMPGTRLTFASRPARFVRLTETLTDAAVPWSIAELHVLRAPAP